MSGFVGRGRELAPIQELVAEVAAGVGGSLLVLGEQGIGKSALLRAGLAGAAGSGCRVLWGAADELEQQIPLRLMSRCLGPEGREALAAGPGDSLGGPMPGDPVLAAVERVLVLVDQLCAVSPVVVVVEDLHWADEASLLVWRRLSRAVRQLPLLMVGSCRPTPGHDQVERLRRGVVAGGGVVLSLGPMLTAEVHDLAGSIVGARPGRRLADVVGQAGGNPLYVRELVDALVREGRVAVRAGRAELMGEPGGVPVSLAAAIGDRLAALPAPVAAMLRWAAVLGQEFSVTDLTLVMERQAGDLMEMVEQALAAGVVAEAGLRLAFRHGLIRQAVYEGITRPVRAALHLQAARALERAGAGPGQVAAHLVAVPELAEEWAWEWLARAAPALAYQAPRVAAELLRRGLGQLPVSDPRREVLEASLVTVAHLLLLPDEVERVARPLLARTADPDRAAGTSWLLAYSLAQQGRVAEAAEVGEQALARPDISPLWRPRVLARQAMSYVLLDRVEEGQRAAEQALAGADQTGDPIAAGYALHLVSYLHAMRRDGAGTQEYCARALEVIGDDPRATDLRLILLANHAAWLENTDRLDEAGEAIREGLALAERAGTPRLGLMCTAAADYYIEVGQWDDALAVLEAAEGMPGTDYMPVLLHGQIAMIAAHRDDWDGAREHLAAVQDEKLETPALRSVAYCLLRARALAAERAGDPAAAVAVLTPCLDREMGEGMGERYLLLPPLARYAMAAGDDSAAQSAVRAAAEEVASSPLPIVAAAADVCRGVAAADPGPLIQAAGYYEAAGRRLDWAQALEDAAILLATRGERPAAQRALAGAAAGYESLGARWDLRRATSRLRVLGIRRGRGGAPPRPATGWAALTPTETVIARLVAEGRSNPDIAAELVLSRNTVQTHVSHILAKLGARSRADIVRMSLQN
jgi:DNA-binding CsgD family transcriptional regulator/tetratricopeptide (TPR) repeat protein